MSVSCPGRSWAAGTWGWPILAGLLILASAGLRLVYLGDHCRLDLAPDEAHYWDWSRHLDWSYYSKGPLVAYLIRGGCALAAPWSQWLTASDMLAVRLPAVVCGALLLVSLYVLTWQVYGRHGLAATVVALALTLPVIGAGSTLMTIDAPYTCCWGWALVLGYQAVIRHSAWAWPAAGLVIGLGILAKYTMVLWLPSAGLFLLTSPAQRRQLFQPGFWIMVGVAALCCLPIIVWNAGHHWVTFRHVHRQTGLGDAEGIHWLGPMVYLGGQFALFLGYWFIAWVVAMIAYRPGRAPEEGVRYLWWMSAPMFTLFLLFSLKTGGGEANWPVTTYESGLVLVAAWLVQQLQSPCAWYRRWTAINLAAACLLGVTVTLLMHHSDWVQPVLVRLSGPPSGQHPFPLRRFDPTCRLRGWRMLAQEVDHLRADLRQQEIDPVLAGAIWSLPGELGFYCDGHPAVYSLGLVLGDRHSQYDFWHPNPLDDASAFAGRTFIFVGHLAPVMRQAFDRIEAPRLITYQEGQQPIITWEVTVCRGFRGFQNVPGIDAGPSF